MYVCMYLFIYSFLYLRGACAPNPATEPNIKDHDWIDEPAWRARGALAGPYWMPKGNDGRR